MGWVSSMQVPVVSRRGKGGVWPEWRKRIGKREFWGGLRAASARLVAPLVPRPPARASGLRGLAECPQLGCWGHSSRRRAKGVSQHAGGWLAGLWPLGCASHCSSWAVLSTSWRESPATNFLLVSSSRRTLRKVASSWPSRTLSCAQQRAADLGLRP